MKLLNKFDFKSRGNVNLLIYLNAFLFNLVIYFLKKIITSFIFFLNKPKNEINPLKISK